MKAKLSLILFAILLAGALTACSQARSDAQIAGDVQGKINSDANVATKQITVQSANGVVTLSGSVTSDAERAAAANDAAQVAGVKTVVNNLTTGTQSAQATPPAPAPEAQPEPKPAPAVSTPAPAPRRTASRRDDAPALKHRPSPSRDYGDTASDTTTTASSSTASSSPNMSASSTPYPMTPPANTVTAPPPPPAKVTVPDGTVLAVRLIDTIDTERNHEGDSFRATLDSPITVDDQVVIPADADVRGQIVSAKQEGHYTGQSALALELTQVSYNGHTYSLKTNQYTRQGSSRSKNTAAKVGTGAAVGAVLGGIFGGGKGAAIGAASGAGVGGAAQTINHPDPIRLPSESVVNFRLQNSVTVTPSNATDRNSGRRRMDQ